MDGLSQRRRNYLYAPVRPTQMSTYSELLPPTQLLSNVTSDPSLTTRISFQRWSSFEELSLASAFDPELDLGLVIRDDREFAWDLKSYYGVPFIHSIVVSTLFCCFSSYMLTVVFARRSGQATRVATGHAEIHIFRFMSAAQEQIFFA